MGKSRHLQVAFGLVFGLRAKGLLAFSDLGEFNLLGVILRGQVLDMIMNRLAFQTTDTREWGWMFFVFNLGIWCGQAIALVIAVVSASRTRRRW